MAGTILFIALYVLVSYGVLLRWDGDASRDQAFVRWAIVTTIAGCLVAFAVGAILFGFADVPLPS